MKILAGYHAVRVSYDVEGAFGRAFSNVSPTLELIGWIRNHIDRTRHFEYAYYDSPPEGCMVFEFRDPKVAMLFKLTWGGG